MCKAFSLQAEADRLLEAFELDERPDWRPRRMLTTQGICPIVVLEENRRVLREAEWGFVPAHARGIGLRPVNARSETAAEKPAFEVAFLRRRCLIPATGFCEYKSLGAGRRQPMLIRMRDRRPFAMGGIWDKWDGGVTPLLSFALLTTEPNAVVAPIHCRMPVVVPREAYDAWLDPSTALEEAKLLTKPFPAELMEAIPFGPEERRIPVAALGKVSHRGNDGL